MNTNMPRKANQNNIQKVFSKRLARALRFKGFAIVGTEPNKYKPQFDVYLFENSVDLQKAISELNSVKI